MKTGRIKSECKGHDGWISNIQFDVKSKLILTLSENLKVSPKFFFLGLESIIESFAPCMKKYGFKSFEIKF